jgi:hypothetical protein
VADLELLRQVENLKQQADVLRQLKKAVRKVDASREVMRTGTSSTDMSQLTGALQELVQSQKKSQNTMIQGFQSVLSTLAAGRILRSVASCKPEIVTPPACQHGGLA